MQNYRFVRMLFVITMATTAVLVMSPRAQAEDLIVKLVSGESGKCLQPANGSLVQGAAIVQATCNGSIAQQWTVTSVSSTKVHLVNRSSHLCLDARGKAVNGTPIQQWTCNKISNENWSLGITNNILSSGISNTFSHCVATPGNQDGLPMELRFCSSSTAQIWTRPPG
jgi:Ricin-type beta-trefoil lectin domain-like